MSSGVFSVIHTVDGLHPRLGGPSQTVPALVSALQAGGSISVRLISQSLYDEYDQMPFICDELFSVASSKSRLALKLGLPLKRLLEQEVTKSKPALFHDHGIWLPSNHSVAVISRSLDIPRVVHPRGMLEPRALAHKGWKKRLANTLYQRRDLESVRLFFATAEREAEGIRQFGMRQPIAVIANGVRENLCGKHKFETDIDRSVRTVLFLSRIHPMKGLLNLVRAWSLLRPKGWRLCIAGPDDVGHWAEVLAEIRRAGVEEAIEYVGEVGGEEKASAFMNADLFVLPTFTENFGVAVAEALSCGLPVITTRGAPWSDLEKHGCGWWVDIGVEPLAGALKKAMDLSDEERRAMGKRGRIYAQRFDWSDIARQTADVYSWILGQGPLPSCVYLD